MTRGSPRPLALIAALLILAGCGGPKHGYFTTTDKIRIHYIHSGRGTPVILLHGLTSSAEGNWLPNGIFDALARNHHVIAIDMRGHGKSDKPHDPRSYGPRMALDVIELMDHLGIDKAHIHGYSMGGNILQWILAKSPDRFITAIFGGSGVHEWEPAWIDKTPPDKTGRPPVDPEIRKAVRARRREHDEEAIRAMLAHQGFPGEWPQLDLNKVTFPVMAINGEFDSPNAKTHRLARVLPRFHNVVLPGKGHMTSIMAETIPPEYIQELVRFIDANDPK